MRLLPQIAGVGEAEDDAFARRPPRRAAAAALAPPRAESPPPPTRGVKRAVERKPVRNEDAAPKRKVGKSAAVPRSEEEEEEEEEEDEMWLYRAPKKGVMGPFSRNQLQSFRPGFEKLRLLDTMTVWRVGTDELLQPVPLLDVMEGRVS